MYADPLQRRIGARLASRSLPVLTTLAAALVLGAPAPAQTTFSINYEAATVSTPDSFGGIAITEGDILGATTGIPAVGAQPPPGILVSGGAAGLGLFGHAACVGHPSGVPCAIELDAHSFGLDGPAMPGMPPGSFWFSVDKFAVGTAGLPSPPTVRTEAAAAVWDASGDVFVDLGLPPAPTCPPFLLVGNTGAIDGDGRFSGSGFRYPGLGLIEPNPPVQRFPPADDGDNLDSVDVDGPLGQPYFSLDAAFIDPLTGLPNTGSALANGVFGADVLTIQPPGGPPIVYAFAGQLGLVHGEDDIDALAVWENGAPGYQPSGAFYDWLGGNTDMVLFSVRRGSSVIGSPDSACLLPIEPGDILTTPVPGGPTPFPAIFIAAEELGLLTTRTDFVPIGDELDALDVTQVPLLDCQPNGVEDAVDLGLGPSCDGNGNGIPDECEPPVFYCSAKTTSASCVPFMSTTGTPSVTAGPFQLISDDHVQGQIGVLLYGLTKSNLNFHGGKLCVNPFTRVGGLVKATDGVPCATCPGLCRSFKRNFNQIVQSGADPALTCGQRVFAQWRQRDPTNTIGGFADNLSDAVRFLIGP